MCLSIFIDFDFSVIDYSDVALCIYLDASHTKDLIEVEEFILDKTKELTNRHFNSDTMYGYQQIFEHNFKEVSNRCYQELRLVNNSIYTVVKKHYDDGFRPQYGRVDLFNGLELIMER